MPLTLAHLLRCCTVPLFSTITSPDQMTEVMHSPALQHITKTAHLTTKVMHSRTLQHITKSAHLARSCTTLRVSPAGSDGRLWLT